jgi:hypothetical protein
MEEGRGTHQNRRGEHGNGAEKPRSKHDQKSDLLKPCKKHFLWDF